MVGGQEVNEKPEQSGFFYGDLIFISGGQTGADFAGLEAARFLNFQTSGYAAKNFMTEKGRNEQLQQFGLIDGGYSYKERTILNASISDLTILFCINFDSPGTKCLIKGGDFNILKIDLAHILQLEQTRPVGIAEMQIQACANLINHAVLQPGVRVVNVAGNRESASPGNIERLTKKILFCALTPLRFPAVVA